MKTGVNFPIHRSAAGVKYMDALADAGILVKEIIESETEIAELEKLIEDKQPLPEGVYEVKISGNKEFIRVSSAAGDMTTEEIRLYIALKQARDIHAIKCWVTFFGIVAVFLLAIGLAMAFIR